LGIRRRRCLRMLQCRGYSQLSVNDVSDRFLLLGKEMQYLRACGCPAMIRLSVAGWYHSIYTCALCRCLTRLRLLKTSSTTHQVRKSGESGFRTCARGTVAFATHTRVHSTHAHCTSLVRGVATNNTNERARKRLVHNVAEIVGNLSVLA